MPPITQEVLDGIAALQTAAMPPGWRGILNSAHTEIQRLLAAERERCREKLGAERDRWARRLLVERERWQARVSELVAALDRHHGTPCEQIRHQQELAAERERGQELLEQHTIMSNEAAGAAVAAERERWQVAVEAKLAAAFQHGWTWTKIRDEIFAAIRKDE